MAEKIFFIIVLAFISLYLLQFVIDVVFDYVTDRKMQSSNFLSSGGPIRNITYFDKDGNVIYHQDYQDEYLEEDDEEYSENEAEENKKEEVIVLNFINRDLENLD